MLRGGGGGVAESAQVDGEHPVVLAQQGDQLVEDPPGLREAVNQQDGRSGGAGGHVVQLGAVEADPAAVDTGIVAARRFMSSRKLIDKFALRAVDAGADTASELGRRLSVTKQAAAQTIAVLEGFGYVDREPDPSDTRRKRVRVTPRGHELMTIGGALFDDVRSRWAARIGPEQLEALETHLAQLTERRSFTAEDLQD